MTASLMRRSPCCSSPLRNKGADRWCCTTCGRYLRRSRGPSRVGTIRRDSRGRARIWLGKGHPYANSAGWQWLNRYLVMADLGERLRRDEHSHHKDGNWTNDRPSNLEVLLAEFHGRLHGLATVLYRHRDALGRFLPEARSVTRRWPPCAARSVTVLP